MICGRCQEDRDEMEFSVRSRQSGKRHKVCKICHREMSKRHYNDNKKDYLERARREEVRNRNRSVVWSYLLQNPCVDCGETDPIVLEFDHVRGVKYKSVSAMVVGNGSVKRIIEEIEKCDVRCANCHKRRHAKDSEQWRFLQGSDL